ncbi:hypothetical protein DKX38_018985 [Salix brachista]|uniref:Proteasome alpha-type subunits domain-containing protein n=1 Tax=Salix brachista TaxID=2182728 RepID=A0A5N5KPI2_9ROSI|nr:hypothetical protein DKX38_018985 [Salix brachista]
MRVAVGQRAITSDVATNLISRRAHQRRDELRHGLAAFELQKLVIVVEKQRGFYPMSSELHVFCCSGMGPDFRVLVRRSRTQAEQYHRLYKEPIPVTQLVRETAVVMQEPT